MGTPETKAELIKLLVDIVQAYGRQCVVEEYKRIEEVMTRHATATQEILHEKNPD